MHQTPRRLRVPVAVLAVVAASGAGAAEVQRLSVTRQDAIYLVHMRVRLDVPAHVAFKVFADPLNLTAVNPSVQVARMNADQTELYTEVHVCVALFCRTLRQTQRMRYSPRPDGGHIEAKVISERSDFRSGTATWEFQAAGPGATMLDFDAQIEPAFWIPPLIGPYLVERSMRQEAERTSAGIESLARGSLAPRDAGAPSTGEP